MSSMELSNRESGLLQGIEYYIAASKHCAGGRAVFIDMTSCHLDAMQPRVLKLDIAAWVRLWGSATAPQINACYYRDRC